MPFIVPCRNRARPRGCWPACWACHGRQPEFDAILARIQAADIEYRSSVRGPRDRRINTGYGGRMIYSNEPYAHQWKMLTVSHARARCAMKEHDDQN